MAEEEQEQQLSKEEAEMRLQQMRAAVQEQMRQINKEDKTKWRQLECVYYTLCAPRERNRTDVRPGLRRERESSVSQAATHTHPGPRRPGVRAVVSVRVA